MNHPIEDRRRNRSNQARPALQFQLDHIREEFGFQEVILATEAGDTVAWAGDEAHAGALAARVPELGEPASDKGRLMAELTPQVPSLAGHDLVIRQFEARGRSLYLCVVSEFSDRVSEGVGRMQVGVARILGNTQGTASLPGFS